MGRTELWINGYRLTTAEIIYRLPDHLDLLQSYIWQDYDLAPRFPELNKFLAFWERKIEGPLHSVRVASTELITPKDFSHAKLSLALH